MEGITNTKPTMNRYLCICQSFIHPDDDDYDYHDDCFECGAFIDFYSLHFLFHSFQALMVIRGDGIEVSSAV